MTNMLAPWSRALALSGALLALSGAQAPVFGHGHGGNVVYAAPVETVWVSSSYVVPSSYILPTSYLLPTVYATSYFVPTYTLSPTAYVLPTYYRASSYVASRRIVERPIYTTTSYEFPTTTFYPTAYEFPTTTFYPTAYYYPTVAEYPLVSTAWSCCDEVAPSTVKTVPAETTPAPRAARPTPPAASDRIPSEVESTPAAGASPQAPKPEEHAPSSYAEPPRRSETERPLPLPLEPGAVSPPAPTAPVEDKEMNTIPLPPTRKEAPEKKKKAGAAIPPVAPTSAEPPAGTPIEPPLQLPEETIRHQARKPVTPFSNPPTPRSTESILAGKVVAHETGSAEEGVRITISNRLQTFPERVEKTDALGRFAVRLPDGDWSVKVTMPSGRTYAVSNITVSNGKLTDDLGRDIPSLTITR
jgi:hypothetical protein